MWVLHQFYFIPASGVSDISINSKVLFSPVSIRISIKMLKDYSHKISQFLKFVELLIQFWTLLWRIAHLHPVNLDVLTTAFLDSLPSTYSTKIILNSLVSPDPPKMSFLEDLEIPDVSFNRINVQKDKHFNIGFIVINLVILMS